jgi:nicotinamidase-related amidase
VTEYCVRLAAKGLIDRGRLTFIVQDAIETLKTEDGKRALEELRALGAKFVTTDQALAMANAPA